MKIAIEAQRIFRPNKHGMDYVILECIRELQKEDFNNEYYILVSPGIDVCLTETPNFHIIKVKMSFYPFWEQIGLLRILKKIKPDVLHCTSNTAPLFCNIPLVLTLHDIIFLGKKEKGNFSFYQNLGWYYRRLIVPQILPKCKKIITVSFNQYNNIISTFPFLKEKLTVIYNGFGDQYQIITDSRIIAQKYINKPFLFHLGNTDPRKNTRGVLRAYALYLKKTTHPKYLLIGSIKSKFIEQILQEEHLHEIKPFLVLIGYIPNEDLPAIYNEAFAFLYPSFTEGFGIPILEAMACGTPVITSNLSAMPEIAGRDAILINPYKENEIVDAIFHLENNDDFYQQQVKHGLHQIQKFSWKKTAISLLSIYKQITNI